MDAPSEYEAKKRLGSCYVCEAWYWTGKKTKVWKR